jgi:hypothetical protein
MFEYRLGMEPVVIINDTVSLNKFQVPVKKINHEKYKLHS